MTGSPLVSEDTISVVTRNDRGVGISAFDRATGKARFHLAPGVTGGRTSWLAVDDTLFANTDHGELIAFDALTGGVRYRQQLAPGGDDGAPRRLEPVLRSGALFVPQRQVSVLRPRDGALLGTVECDVIPDLLRVDEGLSVYVAEESGHVAAFGAGARLSLVKG